MQPWPKIPTLSSSELWQRCGRKHWQRAKPKRSGGQNDGRRKRRGRKPLTKAERRCRARILKRWEKAKAAGTARKDFLPG